MTSVLVATVDGVYSLERDGTSHGWMVGNRSLAGTHVSALLQFRGDGPVFAGAYGGGLFVSEDDGRTWRPSSTGILAAHRNICCLAAQPRGDGCTLWAGSHPAALYRSDDFGGTWSRLYSYGEIAASCVRQITFQPGEPDVLYVCSEPGPALTSSDAGRSWRRFAPREAQRIVVTRNSAKFFAVGDTAVFASEDAGQTWKELDGLGESLAAPVALLPDPRNERVLYAAGAGTRGPRVLRSGDGGRTWIELRNGLPEQIDGAVEAAAMHRWLKAAALLVATSTGEVFGSENGGDEWETIASGLPPIARAYKSSVLG